MKTVFLFDPKCLSYRIKVYQYFQQEFKREGFYLQVFYEDSRKPIDEDGFHAIKYSFLSFLKLFRREKPDVAIYFIWLRYKFSLPFIIFNRLFLKTKAIVWSKGINISGTGNKLMNNLYYLRQKVANALILYSDFEKQFIKTKMDKVFVANNTIDQYSYYVGNPAIDIRKELEISSGKVVLFVGRVEKRKNLDLLTDVFASDLKDHHLVIVGPGVTEKQQERIEGCDNIHAVGGVYDQKILSAYFQAADAFCIPGHIGLGVNEAFLFGIPVVTARIGNDPDLISSEPIMLLKEGENCELFEKNSQEGLQKALHRILDDEDHLKSLKKAAKITFDEKAKIEYMRDGFINAINYVTK